MKKSKKIIKTKLFDSVKEESFERDFLLSFIKVGTDITMLNTTFSKEFLSEFAFERKTVMDIEKHKIIFQRYTPEVGYLRHFSCLFRPHELVIHKFTQMKIKLIVKQDCIRSEYLIENY